MKRQDIILLSTLAGIVIIGLVITIAITLNREPEEQRTASVSTTETTQPQEPATQVTPGQQPAGDTNVQPQTPVNTGKSPAQKSTSAGKGTAPAGKGGGPSEATSTSNLQNEINTAIAGDKPVMLDFGATWCPACRQMKPIVDDLQKNYSDVANIIYIDIDKNQDLAQKYNISAIPTQIFFKNGEQVARHEGVYPKADILNQFKKMGANNK